MANAADENHTRATQGLENDDDNDISNEQIDALLQDAEERLRSRSAASLIEAHGEHAAQRPIDNALSRANAGTFQHRFVWTYLVDCLQT